MTAQKFGGPWTVLKIETVAAYLKAFCTALQAKPTPSHPFRRIYIDGFAGSGEFEFGGATQGFSRPILRYTPAHRFALSTPYRRLMTCISSKVIKPV
jgi:three-Cys-motif partner protein